MSELPQFERRLDELREEIDRKLGSFEERLTAIALQAVAAQQQIAAHIAVCDERQRQIERRQEDRRRWEEERTIEWRSFQAESRADRAQIRDSIQMTGWRIMIAVVTGIILTAMGALFAAKPGTFGLH